MVGNSIAEVPSGPSLDSGSRRRKSRVLSGLLPLVCLQLSGPPLLSLPLGCGPSIQPIHEGGVRFEHCYRLDLDPKIAPAHRHACWKQWLAVYSYGQSRDRLEYSRRRVRDLEAGDPNPPRLNLEQEEEAREARQFYMATPAPTSVHAPPPPVAAPAGAEPLTPADTCVAACRTARAACLSRCETPAVNPAESPATPPASSTDKATTAPPTATPKPAASSAATPAGKNEESTVGECDCEGDYKMCGGRCFE